MTGFGVRRPGSLGWRWLVGIAAALVMPGATGSALAGTRTAAPHSGASTGTVEYAAPIGPRTVRPPVGNHTGQPSAPGADDPDAEPPPGLGGGDARTGLPAVAPDVRPGSALKANRLGGAFGSLAATGSFASLETLTGATFANTCTSSGGSCNGAEPPDTQMAVGQNEVVEAVNNNLFVFGRGGTQLAAYPLTTVFQPSGQTVGLTDPKVVFDASTGNYYLTEMVCQSAGCGANNYGHMGISLAISSNPAAGWRVYDYLNDGQNLQDQEKLGFSGDKITFAVNEYGCKCGSGASYKQENVVVVQKSDVVAGNTIAPAIYHDASSTPTYQFDSMPTTPVNASTSDNTQYVVWAGQKASGNKMKLIRITGTPNASNVDFTGTTTDISIANQTAPPTPVAQGANLAGDKQNFQSSMVQGNDLWAVATDGCTPQVPSADTTTRACTRLVEIDLSSNGVATDTDIGTVGTYRINPSVSKDSTGHVFFGFTIASATTYATAAIDASALPLPTVLQRIDLATGDMAYGGGRWGDYSGTQQDPANTNDVWTAQEFGGCGTGCTPSFTGGPLWATELGQFTFSTPQITSISPTQGPVTGADTVDIYGAEFANGGTTVKFGSTASPTVTWLDSTHIRAVSPAGSLGTVDVTATTAAGTSNTSSSDQYTYIKIPTTTTYTGQTSEDYNDSATLSATLTNNLTSNGVAGKTIAFTVGAESCSATTNSSGVASCSVVLLDTPASGYSATATFSGDATYDTSSASSPFTVKREETALSYGGAVTSHYHDSFTASATMTDPDGGAPISGKPVTFTLGVGDTCTASTNASGIASCSITPTQTATKPLSVAFGGDAFFVPSGDSKTFSITPEETTMTYTGPTVILAGASGATLTATLVEDGSNDGDGDGGSAAPNPAETVTLSIGSQSCNATTNGAGAVTCTIASVSTALGPQTVTASFAGDTFYQSASASRTAIVFAFPSRGAFALGNQTVAAAGPATTVNWWNNDWYQLNSLSGGAAPPAFKGFIAAVTLPTQTPANRCGGTWTTAGGNSPPPPATVPSYMGTVVSAKVTKSGNVISGDYASIVVVKTDPGYAPSPQNAGHGKIVATFCP